MKTPMLMDVPKTHPSRKEKLAAFKKEHDILTHYCRALREAPWTAIHRPSAVKACGGYGATLAMDLFDLTSKYCGLLVDAGLLVEGKTEREAVRLASSSAGIKCDL